MIVSQSRASSAASVALRVTPVMRSPPSRKRVWLLLCGPAWPPAVGLEPADLASAVSGHGGDQLAMLIGDPQVGVAELDGDDLAGVSHADLDARPHDPSRQRMDVLSDQDVSCLHRTRS
jgi:hypothetical protein